MKFSVALALLLVPLLLSVTRARSAENATPSAGSHGEVLLDNARVRVQRFVVPPAGSTDPPLAQADELLVFIHGGVLKSLSSGRSTVWRDGRVVWQRASEPTFTTSTNVGTTAIMLISVTLKPVPTAAAASSTKATPQDYYVNYPNIPGEDLLDNDRLVVQRFIVNPGQWEGVHAHLPNRLYIYVKGGQYAERSKQQREHADPPGPDGEVGWMRAVDISEGHEAKNIGKQPIDLIWVTLKE